MKNTSFFLPMLGIMILAGCSPVSAPTTTLNPIGPGQSPISNSSSSLFGDRKAEISYASKMAKPDFEAMENKDEIQQETYEKPWSREYSLTEDDIALIKKGICEKGLSLYPYPGLITDQIKISKSEAKVGKRFQINGQYYGNNPNPLTGKIIEQIKKYGFGFSEFNANLIVPDYQSDIGNFFEEEWITRMRWIGGESAEDYARYPFNTILVTNDFLLHVFHKLFSNELQYFEESQARPILTELSKTMFTTFHNLVKKGNPDSNISEKDKFLLAYWAIPYALLPSNDELMKELGKRESTMRDNYDNTSGKDPQAEFSDEELKTYLDKRFATILPKVSKDYQTPVKKAWEYLWKADQFKGPDYLLEAYAPDFVTENAIDQDYTQFRPRSHYTNSSFLKTYFKAMKWLMREKFYFGDQKLAETSLYLVDQIPEQQLKNLDQLQQAILALVGTDDDTSIQDIKNFMKKEGINGSKNITKAQLSALKKLRPQKIVSTSYTTPAVGSTNEESAKTMLDGFVFFGEKFTLDSYIFDLLTAGTAETEFLEKPHHHTALIVPDMLENYAPAHELVKLWLHNKSLPDDASHKKIVYENEDCQIGTCKQVSSYPVKKAEAQEKIKKEITKGNLMSTVYHQWLKMLGQLFVAVDNVPYFKTSPLYVFKNLATYMGSYTELKHDTLLYVKQSYAEMGGGGEDECSILVTPPALPVPKGYIEGDVNFIDQLITLNTQTQKWFKDADVFAGFGDYLQKIRAMSLAQMQDKKISDEDFEWLRLSYQKLGELTFPRKMFGDASTKLERGALIADIFTATEGDPLYEAVGRPLLMALMVKDVNGARIVLGPVFSHYEFYQHDKLLNSNQRYTDEDWQGAYDELSPEKRVNHYGIASQELFKQLNK